MFGQNYGLDALLKRPQPSRWQQFIKEPCLYLATLMYRCRQVINIDPINPITIVNISDTHNYQPPDVPHGEILIHAGDLTQNGTYEEVQTTIDWLQTLPHPHKIVVAGNHDTFLDHSKRPANMVASSASIQWGNIVYLDSESTTISCENGRELKIYGCPLTPRHGNWAFQYPRTRDTWHSTVPTDTDILITHGPPKGHLDLNTLGCQFLLDELWRTKPMLHVFGHVHAGHGTEHIQFDGLQKAYENTVADRGGIRNLGHVLVEFVLNYFTPRKESTALLVNAAMIGGLRDEYRRRPIVVHI
ncbi:Metallo-dependent phosphatase [Aaosphaeria arxii CBS 175.79]|uniref:Metallo-dependent phosphatase n=1 Tax=Aaosphaeria arxii CBS 175.79 TaxID=1450172 RepID=A0A6A5YAI2_9PLEO|nr:Metallo-dependent phosphatase [Aaosphaeria arxii CBS 175.79]KAF2021800.1 Metallo-dependent phosphatase [Aaosphaeria arxii CBS 175.79]